MDIEDKQKIDAYLQNQIARAEDRLGALTIDDRGNKLPKRSAYLVLNKYLREFNQGKTEPRWVAVPGLRGTGKTTLLAQIYSDLRCQKGHKLYISLDEAVRTLGIALQDIISRYEELLGVAFEKLDTPIYLFLDEVQYEPSWGLVLKTIYDRSKKVFVICTGSSALSLQTNADVARRVVYTKLYPLCFTEFIMIKHNKYPVGGLADSMRKILYNSDSAQAVFDGLKSLETRVNSYWIGIDNLEIDTFLKYGTLPFALRLNQEPLIYTQINQTLNNVLTRDVPQLNKFDKSTIDRLSQILYAVSSADVISFQSISRLFGLNVKTIISVFDALEKTELLLRVYPHSSHFGQVRKPSKFLFSSPAYRSMYYNLVGSTITFDNYKGKLLEDIVGFYLYRVFIQFQGSSLTYDSAGSGADFIVDTKIEGSKPVVIEVGSGKKSYAQTKQTLEKVGGKYGLVISTSDLGIDNDCRCVSVPLKYFLLT